MGHLRGRCVDFAELTAAGEIDKVGIEGAGVNVGVDACVTGNKTGEGGECIMATAAGACCG